MSDPLLRIAITGLDSKDNPYPGLALARALKHNPNRRCTILGLTYDAQCTGIYHQPFIDEIQVIPYPSDPEQDLLAVLLRIQETSPIDVLIPALDSEIAGYARLAEDLLRAGIRTVLPTEAAVKARNKTNLVALCRDHGVHTPKTEVLNLVEQLDFIGHKIKLPYYLKGPIIDAKKATTIEEARYFYRQIFKEWGYPVLVQEAITGEEIDVSVLVGRDHRPVGMVQIKKFGITSRGKAFAGVVIHNERLQALAEHIVSAFQWVGPCELELMQEASTGQYYLLEMNARFPAWIYLSVAGTNLLWAHVDLALGNNLPTCSPPPIGTLFFRNVVTQVLSGDRFADVQVANGVRR